MVDDAPEPPHDAMRFGAAGDAPVLALFARVLSPTLPPALEARVLGAVLSPPPKDPLARLFFAHGDEAWSFLLAATGEPDVAKDALEDALFRVHRRLTHKKHAGEELDGPALDGGPGQALVLGCARESAADAWDVLKKSGREPPRTVVDAPARPCPGARELLARVVDRAEKERAHLAGVKDLSVKIAVVCTYCHAALSRGEAVYCASCLAPHHEECFREHGRCTAPGCGEKLVVRAGAPTPYHRPRRRRPFIIGFGLAAALSGAALVGQLAVRSTSEPNADRLLSGRVGRDHALAVAERVEAEGREKLARVEAEARQKLAQAERDAKLQAEKLVSLQREADARERKYAEALADAEAARASRRESDLKAKQREIEDLRSEKYSLQDENIELARRFDVEKQRLQAEADTLREALAKEDLRPDALWKVLVDLAADRRPVDPVRAATNGELDLEALFGELETQAKRRDLSRLTVVLAATRQRLERARATLTQDQLGEWTRRLEALDAGLCDVERRELLFHGLNDLQALEAATQRQAWDEAEACALRLDARLARIARSQSPEARAAGTHLARIVGPAARGMRAERALLEVAAKVERIVIRGEGVFAPRAVVIGGRELKSGDAVPDTRPEVIVVSVGETEVLLATESRKRVVTTTTSRR